MMQPTGATVKTSLDPSSAFIIYQRTCSNTRVVVHIHSVNRAPGCTHRTEQLSNPAHPVSLKDAASVSSHREARGIAGNTPPPWALPFSGERFIGASLLAAPVEIRGRRTDREAFLVRLVARRQRASFRPAILTSIRDAGALYQVPFVLERRNWSGFV